MGSQREIGDLVKVLSPPEIPIENDSKKSWLDVEKRLDLKFPEDYKKFINIYGTGCINKFLWVLNPFASNQNLNMLEQIEPNLGALRDLRECEMEDVPFPLYPEPNGLLPWGATDNGDVLYWITRGKSSDWIVCVNASRDDEWETFEYSMASFLVRLLTKKIKVEIFPEVFFPDKPFFSIPEGTVR